MGRTLAIGQLFSKEYLRQLRRMYKAQEWGGSGHKRADDVLWLMDCFGREPVSGDGYTFSMLDYGCGQGLLKKELEKRTNRLQIVEYDPAIRGKELIPPHPERFDLVTCTDVLEHIEPEYLDAVINHIARLSARGMFLMIALRPANKNLPDGRNAHLVVENADWWLEKIKSQGWEDYGEFVRTEITKGDRDLKLWFKWYR